MNTFRSICLIPAKEESKRLKNKNILKLAGRELISYPIKSALESKLFNNDVIVSTESVKIKNIAEKYRAKVPYLRPSHLAQDPFGIGDVALDFLETFEQYKEYDFLCLLLPTAPLMISQDIKNTFEILINNNYEVVMSVSETEHNAHRCILVENNTISPLYPDKIKKRSQELVSTYRINGACAFIKIDVFLRSKSLFLDQIGAYIMPPSRSVDIDTLNDFKYAEYLILHDK